MESEHEIQKQFINWFRGTYPEVRILAIPNGGHRNPIVGAKLKEEGVSAGVPDLFIPKWMYWLEIKSEKGRVSLHQKEWIEYLRTLGYTVAVGYGLENCKDLILNFKKESKK